MDNVYTVSEPTAIPVPLVVDSPHSGSEYPEDFGYSVDLKTLRTAEDAFVNELCQDAPSSGAVLLAALFPRAYVDPNRDEDDISPEFISEPYPHPLNPGPKSSLGIGLVRQKLANGASIYDRKLSPAEFAHRIESCHRPYHHKLKQLLDRSHARFAAVWHLDMHSMASKGNAVTPDGHVPRPYDVVLGDLDGLSCDADFTAMIRDVLDAQGLRVRVNDPYKGAAITRRYGRPSDRRYTLQIELNRALYLDEVNIAKTDDFDSLRKALATVFDQAAAWARDNTNEPATEQ